MPIHNNVAFFRNGVKCDAKKVVILLMGPSPRLIVVHQLIGLIREIAEHAVLPNRESHVHPLFALADGELRAHVGEDLNIKLAGLQSNGSRK